LEATAVQQENKQSIPIDAIIWDTAQVRIDLFLGIKELANSIKEIGLEHRLGIRYDDDGKPHGVWGRRRFEALKLLGYAELPPSLYEISKVSKKEAVIVAGAENLDRENLSLKEEIALVQAGLDEDWKPEELAERWHKKSSWIQDRIKIHTLEPKAQQLTTEHKITIKTARALSEIPKEIQVQTADEIVAQSEFGYSEEEAKQTINRQVQEHEQLVKTKELLEKSKYPKCPTCGSEPTLERSSWRGADWVVCAKEPNKQDHHWNLKSGKLSSVVDRVAAPESPGKKHERPLQFTTRYDVPIKIIREAIATKALSFLEKRLKEGTAKELHIEMDKWSVTVSTTPEGFRFDFPDDTSATIEEKNYKDKRHNVCRLNVHEFKGSFSPHSQSGIDKFNATFIRYLESLPEIAEWRKKRKHQGVL
jgi:ParB/RepB/Spo0J family partition protein